MQKNILCRIVQKCARRICAEIVHTKMCRKCAHTKCAELCTHTKCADLCTQTIVQKCAQSLCPSCAQSLCPRIVSTQKSFSCITESFCVRVNILCHVCKVFGDVHREFDENVHVQNCAQTVHCANVKKRSKMTKNDQNRQFGQNVPKWPKMAQNGRKCPGWVHDWSPAPCD